MKLVLALTSLLATVSVFVVDDPAGYLIGMTFGASIGLAGYRALDEREVTK